MKNGKNMNPDQEKISQWLEQNEQEMFVLLKKMVEIQSGTSNKKGVDRMGDLIRSTFKGMGVSCKTIAQTECGDHLVVRSRPDHTRKEKQILLTGHMDTVFPENTEFNWYKADSTHSYGPGVVDMKGGLVVGIFALKALDAMGLLSEMPVTFVFNADEETGSKWSRELIETEARRSLLAFVLEAGGLNGEIATGRKGNISIDLSVQGQAGHAAFAGKDKGSAILELAHKTLAIEALNDPDRGISANVGTVRGGIGPNTVAEHASAKIDFRFVEPSDYAGLKAAAGDIVSHSTIPNTTATHQIQSSRPPMPATPENRRLFKAVRQVADVLGIKVAEEFRQGVSDANFIAALKIPVIDGLGPIGAKDHSSDEYMVNSSLLERATLLACTLDVCRKEVPCPSPGTPPET